MLVGLFWQQRIAADGSAEWIFQKAPEGRKVCAVDYRVFWGGLFFFVLIWFVFFLNCLASLDLLWSVMAIVGLVLSSTNFVAYYKCARSQSPAESALSSLRAATWRHAVMSRLGFS
ncbi:hypothetical protein, conserved [Eimeria tenella]|uniref:Golgi apparatus membrane protein TVP23 homolog n=1 Tax=Eimeria tenella TaxID=5802 RepID=U6KYF7_EIMTE|nr:hypothetical protein, conserved [Eimeria tenella]CDJ41938.1 hypothetical protein, conserved [Eimeria tenella]|eukprot:XP_013232688.1 hypothetical protein, conserved [Eimeria tenella]